MHSPQNTQIHNRLFRHLFRITPELPPPHVTPEGVVRVRLSFKDLKINHKFFELYPHLLSDPYCVNTIGEWLLRLHYDSFAALRARHTVPPAPCADCDGNQQRFNLYIDCRQKHIELSFHLSLVDAVDTGGAPAAPGVPVIPDALRKSYIPKDIFKQLSMDVIGQDRAVRTLAVRGALHLQKARMLHQGQPVSAPNECLLFIGPSGCGKTYLAERFGRICGLPFASLSATDFTETGYVGLDVEDSLSSLVRVAGDLPELARFGVLFIDEMDKKAARIPVNFRDAGGASVQQGFLRLMEGCTYRMNVKRVKNSSKPFDLETYGMQFIFGGAFQGLDNIIRRRMESSKGGIGFRQSPTRNVQMLDHNLAEALVEYGMIPEWVNRLTAIILFNRLTVDELVRILTAPHGILASFRGLLAANGLDFTLSRNAARAIAAYAHETNSMSRGLRSVVARLIENIVFEQLQGKVHFGVRQVQAVLAGMDGANADGIRVFINTPPSAVRRATAAQIA